MSRRLSEAVAATVPVKVSPPRFSSLDPKIDRSQRLLLPIVKWISLWNVTPCVIFYIQTLGRCETGA